MKEWPPRQFHVSVWRGYQSAWFHWCSPSSIRDALVFQQWWEYFRGLPSKIWQHSNDHPRADVEQDQNAEEVV